MTLVRYSSDMAGNGDEAGRAGADFATWAAELAHLMRGCVDEAARAASCTKLEIGDLVGAARMGGAVAAITRGGAAVMALDKKTRAAESSPETPEDEMSEHRDYSPERLAALREELLRRCDGHRAILERKRGVADSDGEATGSAAGGDPEAGAASGAVADGLAHLGDAGGTRSGQDLRRRLLAA